MGHAPLPPGADPARSRTGVRGDPRVRREPPALAGAGAHRHRPDRDGRRHASLVPGVPGAALLGARPDQGRHPLRHRRRPRRVRRARDVDDVEVRAPAPALRRREGRRALRASRAVAERADADHAALHRRADGLHRAPAGHPGAGHGDERADDGLDDGHVLDADGLRRAGDRDRQADLDRRLGLPARGDRCRRRDGDRARLRAPRLGPRRAALRRPGLRQRRRHRGDRAARAAARR